MMTDKMCCYLWYDVKEPNIVKFGERWVKHGLDIEEDCRKRIRSSLGVKKGSYDRGEIVVAGIWDVTEIAKNAKRYYKASRMDDYLRNEILILKNTRMAKQGEEHCIKDLLPGESASDKVVIAVSEYLSKQGQPLPYVGLSPWQLSVAEDTLVAIQSGKHTILAELCARFGKTLWSGAIARELEFPVTIIASYVLTSFSSFMKELRSFEQFKDMVLVDMKADDCQDTINEALANGKQVVAFISMCNGSKRSTHLDFLFNLPGRRLVIVDEADYGMKQVNQSKPLVEARKHDDVVILMTGTNADEAGQYWPDAHYVGVTYPELIIAKRDFGGVHSA